ncbi:MAG: hypothetical protein ACK559_36305, partial [bacterium]
MVVGLVGRDVEALHDRLSGVRVEHHRPLAGGHAEHHVAAGARLVDEQHHLFTGAEAGSAGDHGPHPPELAAELVDHDDLDGCVALVGPVDADLRAGPNLALGVRLGPDLFD